VIVIVYVFEKTSFESIEAILTMGKAYGFRTFKGLEIALYHQLGALPEPQMAHTFW